MLNHEMIERHLAPSLLQAAKQYPVVTLTGPRQSGKTTLVQWLFKEYNYCNLEHPEVRRIAIEDPNSFFELYPDPLIIDEVQNVPELLSWIQVRIDPSPRKGRYILTGSHQLRLHQAITQSLAGRTALLRLLPLSMSELAAAGIPFDKGTILYQGCMPRIYNDQQEPTQAYRNYFQTYVERDVRQLIKVKHIALFEGFMRLLAGRIGQPINFSSLSNDVGISDVTAAEWLSILEASFIVFKLPPYFNNFGKRLIKSPKIYFVEPGLAACLLGIENKEQVMRDPLHGNLFENMVVIEALKARLNQAREPHLYFWRDHLQNEVDLVWDRQRKLVPIEIKSAMTWNRKFTKGIQWFQKNIPESLSGYVVYAGDLAPSDDHSFKALNFKNLAKIF